MRITMLAAAIGLLMLGAACGDDDGDDDDDDTTDGGRPDGDGSRPDGNTGDGGDGSMGMMPTVERGDYLVHHVADCSGCHTPFDPMTFQPIEGMFLAGIECFVDVDPAEGAGCLHSRNLTNHPSGLMNRSDDEIITMFTEGRRPTGDALVPIMPYWIFHNFNESDLRSIVMYLRTVPGVDHTVPANEAPWAGNPTPAAGFDGSTMPMPTTVNEETMHGRYLATISCTECHTQLTNPMDFRSIDETKLLAGNRDFEVALFGIPSPPFPEHIYSMNLTPHEMTGIPSYTQADIVRVLKEGQDRTGAGICPPMPAGPMAAFGGLTDDDANAIAAYIKALPPTDNMVSGFCTPPMM